MCLKKTLFKYLKSKFSLELFKFYTAIQIYSLHIYYLHNVFEISQNYNYNEYRIAGYYCNSKILQY